MIDVTFYQFILVDNNQTMQFCPLFLYLSQNRFNVEYFTLILSTFIIKFKFILINKLTMFPKLTIRMLYRLCTYIIFIGYCGLCVIHTHMYM